MKFTLLLMTLFLLGGCATSRDSTLLGMGVGGAVGAGFGAAAGQPTGKSRQGAAIGAGVGAAIGGLAGYMEHKKSGNGLLQSQFDTRSDGSDAPAVTIPEVRRVWVPDQIENDQYIEGHFIYVIDKPSRWRLNDGSPKVKKNGR